MDNQDVIDMIVGANTQANASTCFMCIPLAQRKVEKREVIPRKKYCPFSKPSGNTDLYRKA